MKKIKINLSKTSWIILSVGVFIVVLAGLGVTYSQQIKEKNELQDELAVTDLRLEKFNIAELQQQESQLLEEIEAETAKLESALAEIQQTIESIDVTGTCYLIASQSDVEIIDISSTEIGNAEMGELGLSKIALSVGVTGSLPNIVDYIAELNDNFTTGHVVTVQMNFGDIPPYASIQLVIYSYEGD
jgi:hypothetical protein